MDVDDSVRFSPNDRIGPYLLSRFLGRGSFGEVWLADRIGGIATTRLALKLPIENKVDLEAIRQEANIWIRAGNHPNVLPLFEAEIYDGQVVLSSEYAPDGSLSDWLARHGGRAPSVRTSIEMALGILAGLRHLHERGIIHRDLKPANILMQGDTPRLADFGIARVLTLDADTTRPAGTPAFMAPEAFDGKRSFQTDLWSVGVILFELLTGDLPFAGVDMTSLMHSIMHGQPATLPQSIPEGVHGILAGSLEKDPARRFPTASRMEQDLRKALRGVESIDVFPATSGSIPAHGTYRAYLEIASGPDQGTVHELLKDREVLGRDPGADIHVKSPDVSRYHGQLVRTENGYSFEDLGTRNGSYLNGNLIRGRVPLKSGDRIHTGAMILLYRISPSDEAKG